ncbi:piggyBac transposable element-derived protein 4 [Oryzias latipes]|uniref:PiggyBac transposable element-derived protein domain-containing protein n=1 Tax=Oryzias latipes TaxID=8090 RepID=A0A3B3HL03_ORYLA|nr:piggyBac transposable element-derived protein 4 [Oryzias latipes]
MNKGRKRTLRSRSRPLAHKRGTRAVEPEDPRPDSQGQRGGPKPGRYEPYDWDSDSDGGHRDGGGHGRVGRKTRAGRRSHPPGDKAREPDAAAVEPVGPRHDSEGQRGAPKPGRYEPYDWDSDSDGGDGGGHGPPRDEALEPDAAAVEPEGPRHDSEGQGGGDGDRGGHGQVGRETLEDRRSDPPRDEALEPDAAAVEPEGPRHDSEGQGGGDGDRGGHGQVGRETLEDRRSDPPRDEAHEPDDGAVEPGGPQHELEGQGRGDEPSDWDLYECETDVDELDGSQSETEEQHRGPRSSGEEDVEEAVEEDAEEDIEEEPAAESASVYPDTFSSKNGEIKWSANERDRSSVRASPPHQASGPTTEAREGAQDILSSFLLFFTPNVERLILIATNRHSADKAHALKTPKPMDEIELRAYVGLLILAGVYRSRGEALVSLWEPECGRPIFGATMSLRSFYQRSATLRFDDRSTRASRSASDRLAAVREVWEEWCDRLPRLYDIGPEVTVDERMVPFKGRCSFRQYIPSKPTKYGLKLWVACDARTSYAWRVQPYMGKLASGARETNLASRVVSDLTRGLEHRNVTCDNFFTSYALATELLKRNITLLGTIKSNKPELPPELASARGREALSSRFAFTDCAAALSYVPKKNKNVLLLSTKHSRVEICHERRDKKPEMILDYNKTKGGVDNLDKLLATYSCRRMTKRWPLAMFHNMIDMSAYNAYVIWREMHPDWMPWNRNRRRIFLEQLGKDLVRPLVLRRKRVPRARPAYDLMVSMQEAGGTSARSEGKRKRCQICPRSKDTKTLISCKSCGKSICRGCTVPFCPLCSERQGRDADTDASQ